MQKQKLRHNYYMRKALNLALKAKDARPNPYVGALLVKNKKIIASGFHRKAGLLHAEIYCLDKIKDKAKGATLYVTLEPCSHFGRTPPCVDRIVRSGIKKVVVGIPDPNPLNAGCGIKFLRKEGIKVEVGFLENALKTINAVFIKYITKKIPYVCVKVAQSLDGKIATKNFDSKWITGSLSRAFAHKFRADFDALMVGVNTVLRDNPLLLGTSKNLKIIIDTHLRTPPKARLFNQGKVIIVTAETASNNKQLRLIRRGAQIVKIKVNKYGRVDLSMMMRRLAALEISKILVEGGGELIGSLFDEGLVDKAIFFIAPKIIGGRDAISSVMGEGARRINGAVRLDDIKLRQIEKDFLIEGVVKCSRA